MAAGLAIRRVVSQPHMGPRPCWLLLFRSSPRKRGTQTLFYDCFVRSLLGCPLARARTEEATSIRNIRRRPDMRHRPCFWSGAGAPLPGPPVAVRPSPPQAGGGKKLRLARAGRVNNPALDSMPPDMRHRPCFLVRRRVRPSSPPLLHPQKVEGARDTGERQLPTALCTSGKSAQAVSYRRKPGSPASRARCLRLAPRDPRWADRFKLPLGEAGHQELTHRYRTALARTVWCSTRSGRHVPSEARPALRDHTAWAAARCRVASVTAT